MVGKYKTQPIFTRRLTLAQGFFALGLFALSQITSAEVMFEGYSIIRAGDKAIGYTIQRYELDAKKKQFTATTFMKTNELGGNITESVKAVANDKFQPISLQFVTKSGDKAKMIDAKFTKDKMTGTLTDEKKKTTPISLKYKEGTFLSSFLVYLMLQNGLKVDKNFVYSAIAEEDGAVYSGEALIKSEEENKGQKVYRIINKFKGAEFVSFVTTKGEVLGTTSPLQNIKTELVASADEATKGFTVPSDTLKILFGAVPTGKKNVLASQRTAIEGDSKPKKPAEKPAKAPPEKAQEPISEKDV